MKTPNRAKEIRLKRRAAEKQAKKNAPLSIDTVAAKVESFVVSEDIKIDSIVPIFERYRKKYTGIALEVVISNIAMTSAIHNVFTSLQKVMQAEVAPGLDEAIESAWDLAASSMLLEAAFEASGYTSDQARTFTQAVILKRSEPVAAAPKTPKPITKENLDAVVDGVRQELTKMGIKISKGPPKEELLPTRKQRDAR